MRYVLNDYGNNVVDNFLNKCKANGSYKKVYEDFEDGTFLLESAIENFYDECAWLYLTYDECVFDTLDEWKKDGEDYLFDNITYEDVKNELHKMLDKK